jgi:peptidoglycan-N-acetylglucosamine deacetylase
MALIEQITGRPPTFLRAPGGHLSPTVIETAHQHTLRILGWAVDPQDWRAPSAPAIVDRVVGAARPGAIVVLHDGGGDRTQHGGGAAGHHPAARIAGLLVHRTADRAAAG